MRRSTSSITRIAFASGVLVISVLLDCLVTPRPARAQQALLESRATEFLDTIKQTPNAKVLVCDFFGPTGLTSLGVKLADDLSHSLARVGGGAIQVEDRSQLPNTLHRLELEREHAALVAEAVAEELSVDDVVSGQISIDKDELTLHLALHRMGDGLGKNLEASIIMDPEMKKLAAAQVHDTPQSRYPFAGSDGYSLPICTHCPNAQFSDAAVKHKVQGNILLMVLVGPDGKTIDVRPVRGLPYGLTESATDAVQNWQFKPATDPNGAPAIVRQLIEVAFHLY